MGCDGITSFIFDDITGEIDLVILMVLASTNNNTVEEVSRKTGLNPEVIYHVLEFLVLLGVVKKDNNRYDVDNKIRTSAQLLLDFRDIDEITN